MKSCFMYLNTSHVLTSSSFSFSALSHPVEPRGDIFLLNIVCANDSNVGVEVFVQSVDDCDGSTATRAFSGSGTVKKTTVQRRRVVQKRRVRKNFIE